MSFAIIDTDKDKIFVLNHIRELKLQTRAFGTFKKFYWQRKSDFLDRILVKVHKMDWFMNFDYRVWYYWCNIIHLIFSNHYHTHLSASFLPKPHASWCDTPVWLTYSTLHPSILDEYWIISQANLLRFLVIDGKDICTNHFICVNPKLELLYLLRNTLSKNFLFCWVWSRRLNQCITELWWCFARLNIFIHYSLDSKSLAGTDPPTHTNLDTNSFYTYIHSLQIFHRMRISNIHIGKQYFWENDFILFFSYYQPHSLDYVD